MLAPGSHIDASRTAHFQSGATFADHVLRYVRPHGLLYRREGILGVIDETFDSSRPPDQRRKIQFRPFDSLAASRVFFDTYGPRVAVWKTIQGEADRILLPYSEDHAKLLQAAAASHDDVPEIELVVHGPAFTRKGERLPPGYHAPTRTYSTWQGLDDGDILDPLDLVEDFPFVTSSDKAGFVGALVTLVMRPAIRGNIPIFLFEASAPGSGKTMLVDTVLGGLVLGKRVSAMQLGSDEAERDKRIISILLAGQPLVLLDNLPQRFDSGAFASGVTTETYSARALGLNRMLHATNLAVWCLTANNIQMTEELARRTMPVRLEPPTERRTYRFPNLLSEVLRNRDAYLRGIGRWIERWVDAGLPRSTLTLPSFEDWSGIVGGIMNVNGWGDAWMANRKGFMEQADNDIGDFRKLMEWWPLVGERMEATDLVAACEALGAFPYALEKDTQAKKAMSLGRTLQRFRGRVAGGRKFSVEGSGSKRWYRCVPA